MTFTPFKYSLKPLMQFNITFALHVSGVLLPPMHIRNWKDYLKQPEALYCWFLLTERLINNISFLLKHAICITKQRKHFIQIKSLHRTGVLCHKIKSDVKIQKERLFSFVCFEATPFLRINTSLNCFILHWDRFHIVIWESFYFTLW